MSGPVPFGEWPAPWGNPRAGHCRMRGTMATITSDPHNANRGTERGRGLLEKSLRQYGAGRSVLVDKHGVLIAGNKTADVAAELGLPVRIIETDGHELIAVQRTDLDMHDTAARELAIADNRVGEVSLEWDTEALSVMIGDGVDLTQWWHEDELSELLAIVPDFQPVGIDEQGRLDQKAQCTCPNCGEVFTP